MEERLGEGDPAWGWRERWRVSGGDDPGEGGRGEEGPGWGGSPASGDASRAPAVSCLGAAVSALASAAQWRNAIGGSSWPPTTLKIIHSPLSADPGGKLVIPWSV